MCIYSMIVDQGMRDLDPFIKQPPQIDWTQVARDQRQDDLERRVAALEEMLRAAKIYDEAFEEPDCELESKKQKIQELADELGVEITLP